MSAARRTSARLDREIEAALGVEVGHAGRLRRRPRRWRSSRIQSLMFDTELWTPAEAARWAARHGFQTPKVHVTDHFVHIRQFPHTPGAPERTISLGKRRGTARSGIQARVEGS